MSHTYEATVAWNAADAVFLDGRYDRGHVWRFDGGIEVPASSSPHLVPLPYSRLQAVDPEEAFVASLASCHMLTFLFLAAKSRWVVREYVDHACGVMQVNGSGRLAVTQVFLRPEIRFEGEPPVRTQLESVHHQAHEQCFLANSVKTHITIEIP